MRLTNLIAAVAVLCFALNISAERVDIGDFSIETPQEWINQQNMSGILLISKSPDFSGNTANPKTPPFQNNLVITGEQADKHKSRLFQEDPVLYMEVVLYNTYPALEIQEIKKKSINDFNGVFIISSYTESGIAVNAIQFYTLQKGSLYGIAFTCLAQDFQKSRAVFEQALQSIKKK